MQRSWANAQVRRAYPEFVLELDMLSPRTLSGSLTAQRLWLPTHQQACLRTAPRRLSRSGLPCSDDWLTKMLPWVDQWEQADEHLVHPTGPHTDSSFRAYLTWYLPRTRARLVLLTLTRSHTRRGLRMAMASTTWRH